MNINISGSNIGFASKDSSLIILQDSKLKHNSLCFTAYQKKDEFGPGVIKILDTIKISDLNPSACEKSYLLEYGSKILDKNNLFKPNKLKVFDFLYGNNLSDESK